MKKIIIIVLVIITVHLAVIPLTAHGEYENKTDEITEEVDDILSDYEISWSSDDIHDMSFRQLYEYLKEIVTERITMPLHIFKMLLLVMILTSLLRRLGDGVLDSGNDMYDLICVLTSVAVITTPLIEVYRNSMDTIEKTGGFMMVFVPVFTGITVAAGGAFTGGFYSFTILGATETFIALANSFLMPLLNISIVLSISGSVFHSSANSEAMVCIRKIVTWTLTIFVSLFIGFVILKSNIAAKSDGAASKTVKTIISGSVPIIGGSISDAYSTVRASFDIIRSTAGTAGCIAIIILVLPTILEIIVYRIIMYVISTIAEMLSVDPLVKLIKGLEGGLAIAQSVLVSYTIMLTLSTAIVIQQFS